MIKVRHTQLVKKNIYSYRLLRVNRPVGVIPHQALPVKIIRVTVERMIKRMVHISQPNHFWYGAQTDAYCVGAEETDDGVVFIAMSCVVLILILYGFLVLLRKYEKEHEKN